MGYTYTNTLCMNCEKVSRKKEDFKEFKVEMDKGDTTLERCMLASRCVHITRGCALRSHLYFIHAAARNVLMCCTPRHCQRAHHGHTKVV